MAENIYISLIYKELTKEITASEKATLDNWRSESDENQQLSDDVKLAWKITAKPELSVAVDLDSEFEKLQSKIERRDTAETPVVELKSRTKPGRYPWLRIAAGLILLAGAFYLLRPYLSAPEQVEWVIVESGNDKKTVELTDKSKITLNKNTQLKYPAKFVNKERRLMLDGEAFFEVERNTELPFIVESEVAEVTVLGTSFAINTNNNGEEFVVQVTSGIVQFQEKDKTEKPILKRNNELVFNKKSKRTIINKAASPNKMAWYSGKLEFKETPLKESIAAAMKLYGVTILLENPAIEKCPFTASFSKNELNAFLETISAIFEVKVNQLNGKTYKLQAGTCK